MDFLDVTHTEFKVEFIEYGLHFDGDKYKRDIYQITLKRGERSFSFRFGQSINCSGRFWKYGNHKRGVSNGKPYKLSNGKPSKVFRPPMAIGEGHIWDRNKDHKEPSAYDVLACLEKNDPEDFNFFCDNTGYNKDSISAKKTYDAVKNEYDNLKMLYSDSELSKLQEVS